MNTSKNRLKVMYLLLTLVMTITVYSQTFIAYSDFMDDQYSSAQNISDIDSSLMKSYLSNLQPKLYIIKGKINDRTENGTIHYAEVDTSSIKQLLSRKDTTTIEILTLRITKDDTAQKMNISALGKLPHLKAIHLICDKNCSFTDIKRLFSDSRHNYLIIYSIATPEY